MSESILQSIKPQYCELIASGKKTIEVRKTRPKLQTPFKVYIYCTIGQRIPNGFGGVSEALKQPLWKLRNGTVVNYLDVETMDVFQCEKLNGKVIGEYVCDEITEISADNLIALYFNNPINETCLNDMEMRKYANGKKLYLWHISDLKIYNEPKELSEFHKPCEMFNTGYCDLRFNEGTCGYQDINEFCGVVRCDNRLTRPPQSWCYVEEVL